MFHFINLSKKKYSFHLVPLHLFLKVNKNSSPAKKLPNDTNVAKRNFDSNNRKKKKNKRRGEEWKENKVNGIGWHPF